MDFEEIKSRINPQYQDVVGTESYERKWLCDEIERLRFEHECAHQEAKELREQLATVTAERDELVELLDHALSYTCCAAYSPSLTQEINAALAKVGTGDTAVQGDMLLPANAEVWGRRSAASSGPTRPTCSQPTTERDDG